MTQGVFLHPWFPAEDLSLADADRSPLIGQLSDNTEAVVVVVVVVVIQAGVRQDNL